MKLDLASLHQPFSLKFEANGLQSFPVIYADIFRFVYKSASLFNPEIL